MEGSGSVCDLLTVKPGEVNFEEAPNGFRLIYFDGRGRGEQVRLMFVLSQTKFQDVRFKWRGSNYKKFKSLNPQQSPALFGQIPVLQHNDLNLCQTGAILQYLGSQLKMSPDVSDSKCMAQATMIVNGAEDMRIRVFYQIFFHLAVSEFLGCCCCCLSSFIRWRKRRKLQVTYEKFLASFETFLTQSQSVMFFGSTPTYADVTVFDVLTNISELKVFPPKVLDRYPKVAGFLKAMQEIPHLKAYLESRPKLFP
eukprot:Lithocolla_globosa_v1_NODE_3193_length_1736_cov_14.303391.p1 type:complete len:253 gc:universal NODE_3193_length_1736_cov_14.303391:944-186(-)